MITNNGRSILEEIHEERKAAKRAYFWGIVKKPAYILLAVVFIGAVLIGLHYEFIACAQYNICN